MTLKQYFNSEYVNSHIDNFTITETYRAGKENIKINTFIKLLPKTHKIDDLSKFVYVFIQKD